MAIRSAILIDNFLPQDIFDNISAEIADSPGYTSGKLEDYVRDYLWDNITLLVFERLKQIGLYREHFINEKEIANFSYNQYRPKNCGYGNDKGPHIDNGSYVYYIHPHWDEDWEGRLKIVNALEEQYRTGIYAKPNRFIWMNPDTVHDISTTSQSSEHSRVTNLGFLNACISENPVGTDYINIFTTH